MAYTFYSDWALLSDSQVALLCSIAMLGGEFDGSRRQLYKLMQLTPPENVSSSQLDKVDKDLYWLMDNLYLRQTDFGDERGYVYTIVNRGMPVKIHEVLFSRIKQKHEPSIAWQKIIKFVLFMKPIGYLQCDRKAFARALNLGSSQNVGKIKNVLEELNCVQYSYDREPYKFMGKKHYKTINQEYRFGFPDEYKV